jgi:ankyrin repeat protein
MNKTLYSFSILLITFHLSAMDKKRKKLSGAEAFEQELQKSREIESQAAVRYAEEQLRTFCKSRSLEPVLHFLAASADINSSDRTTGMTALHYAAENGDYSLVQLLVTNGARVNSVDFSGRTPLWYAASQGHEEVVTLLHTLRADIKITSKQGNSALHAAAEHGQLACSALLLALGCPVNGVTENSRTPLHFAALNNHIKVAEQLLANGALLHARTGSNHTPLHEAVRKGHARMVQLLLEREPDKLSMTEELTSTFYLALDYYQASDEDLLKVMEMLLKAGCNPNSRSAEGYTLLHFVIRAGHTPIVRLLLTHHADHHIPTPEGTLLPAGLSPLKIAAKKGRDEIVRLLLACQRDKAPLMDEMTSIMHMVIADYKEGDQARLDIVVALLDAGCSPNSLSQEGYSLVQLAIWEGHSDLAELLLRRGADHRYITPEGASLPSGWSMLHLASHKLLRGICKLLIDKGLDPMALTPDGKQAIQIAFGTNLPGSATLATALHFKNFQDSPT